MSVRKILRVKKRSKPAAVDRVQQKVFLEAVAETGNAYGAFKKTGICRDWHYVWMQRDPEYPAKFQHAEERYADKLESSMLLRAYSLDKEYRSDTLAIFAMKGLKPERYGDKIGHHGNVNLSGNLAKAIIEGHKKANASNSSDSTGESDD